MALQFASVARLVKIPMSLAIFVRFLNVSKSLLVRTFMPQIAQFGRSLSGTHLSPAHAKLIKCCPTTTTQSKLRLHYRIGRVYALFCKADRNLFLNYVEGSARTFGACRAVHKCTNVANVG